MSDAGSIAAAAPIIVTALFGDDDFATLDRLRRQHFPPARNQVPAHLTLFHHLAPSLADELRSRLVALADQPAPRAAIVRLIDLGGGTAFGVDSPGLVEIRADLADAFSGSLTPQDRSGWRPHVTIQNKVDRPAAKALQAVLAADFAPRPLAIAGLAAWYYRGGPWEPLHRVRFNRSGRPHRS